jgi:hypothetical protein
MANVVMAGGADAPTKARKQETQTFEKKNINLSRNTNQFERMCAFTGAFATIE